MVLYEGIFFDDDSIRTIINNETNALEKKVDNLHCTFKFKPSDNEIFDEVVGMDVNVMVIGYGCDGRNSGYEVVLPGFVKDYYYNWNNDRTEVVSPHITVSLAKDGRAVDTRYLCFEPLEHPFVVKGRLGYFISNGKDRYVSFDKYFKSNVRKLEKK